MPLVSVWRSDTTIESADKVQLRDDVAT